MEFVYEELLENTPRGEFKILEWLNLSFIATCSYSFVILKPKLKILSFTSSFLCFDAFFDYQQIPSFLFSLNSILIKLEFLMDLELLRSFIFMCLPLKRFKYIKSKALFTLKIHCTLVSIHFHQMFFFAYHHMQIHPSTDKIHKSMQIKHETFLLRCYFSMLMLCLCCGGRKSLIWFFVE